MIEVHECRESAEKVFIGRAERLERQALSLRTIAHLIKTNKLTNYEEESLWSWGCTL